ncbi:fukutin-related protein isoform X2 [Belonocnema kinseyi]|uniref:fukutin-related protein isoform X2 n=1 Tax=Belonocnema kinseyi TaxID=2817044 RepID=UPI00143D25B7|nr:fukutin-related protein isoform X2 [Belonocnema kinseyi]
MRLRLVRGILVLALLGNIIVWHKIWRLFTAQHISQVTDSRVVSENPHKFHRRLARLVTVVIRQFETFENDVAATVESTLNSFPTIQILILCDEIPYPPLELNLSNSTQQNVRFVNLQPGFNKSFDERNPLFYVQTKFVLILPDATRISSKHMLQDMINHVTKIGTTSVAIGRNSLSCFNLALKIKEWSLRITNVGGTICDAVIGRHVIMMDAKLLRKLSDPFMLPFPDSLFMQTRTIGIKIHILKKQPFNEGKPLHRSQQAQLKMQQLHRTRERLMFEKFGIKKVVRPSSSIEWYGCSRETVRCFGSVVNGIPFYLYQNRYTPPCCLAGLRKVAYHVFDKLEEVGIRFWLEGNSLLGAMRNGDILPWDHEVEIGVNRDDLGRSPWLVKARNKPVTDSHGFVWEKATEGEFFKVQYSKVNRLHVNLLPFYSNNGTMTRDAWFLKNRDFPEQFLHPMSSIDFAGRQDGAKNQNFEVSI